MNGKERILTALELREPDCVPLYIHGINEAPIIGIGKNLTDGLPEPRDFRLMNDREKSKLVDTLFMIHEHFDIGNLLIVYLVQLLDNTFLLIIFNKTMKKQIIPDTNLNGWRIH
jgi:hypothetical protein